MLGLLLYAAGPRGCGSGGDAHRLGCAVPVHGFDQPALRGLVLPAVLQHPARGRPLPAPAPVGAHRTGRSKCHPVGERLVHLSRQGRTSAAGHQPDPAPRRGRGVGGGERIGKSTLGKIITGLYPTSSGRVWWDDVDLATADGRTVHEQVAIIAQEPARWPMTAAVNVRVGRLDRRDPSDEAWHTAIRESGADEVLNGLQRKGDTVLSKLFREGQDLSGGQWQRLGVARGIYRDAAIFDEPTAALDAKAEARVFAGLQHAAGTRGDRAQRTTLLVTHRLANVRHADRILVLDGGRIIESGTHDELIRNGGLYHELFTIQASAYENCQVGAADQEHSKDR
ncbi:ABC transporter ATP-binding protein/permease [Saccharopolyspora sp. K220]|uniref:ATP-binding cassette domain-containing protein n=1 Tax=Saccharopolyspora soli TaxID=2926618 RepID=UPI001F568986|nr:ABC transporter ATP-binding protein [Saccharopolyspora soli]MCI2422376.1 ABC transporter ATP-binding protein/permease [Saccharopolyspora soli]